MKNKIISVLGSLRFWIVTLGAVVVILEARVTNGTFILVDILGVVEVWLATVVGIGTLDSVATKFGVAISKKK